MIAPDQLGFGQSDKPLIDYSIQTYVDFLNEFLHELKIEKATLIGESLGGWISALYTLEASTDKHMVPVERLVLVDAAGLKQDKPIPDLNPSTSAAQRKVLQVVFYDSSWVSDDLVKNDLADRIRSNISYTVHSILKQSHTDERKTRWKTGWHSCAHARRVGETGRTSADRIR